MNEHVANIVAAYVKKNPVGANELPELIASVSQALTNMGKLAEPAAPELKPAVSIRRSVGEDKIICLDCGWSGKMVR
jgi:predicted transcriptional regulator